MVEIKILSDKETWNTNLSSFEYINVFSSYEWGEFKKSQGWDVDRLGFYKNNQLIAMCQILYKQKFKVCLGWNSGGILFHQTKDLTDIILAIKEYYSSKSFSFRFGFYQKRDANNSFALSQILKLPQYRITSPYTITFDLNTIHKMSSNHRYYLKQSQKNDLEVIFQRNTPKSLDDFWNTYNQMSKNKDLSNIQMSYNQIKKLTDCFGDKAIIGNIYHDKDPISSCLILTCNNQAFYYLASSNETGRKMYASYLMVAKLLDFLKNEQYASFNFGGITPYDLNAFGVNRFKMGFGGDTIEYLGEWELYNSKISNLLFNFFVSRKT